MPFYFALDKYDASTMVCRQLGNFGGYLAKNGSLKWIKQNLNWSMQENGMEWLLFLIKDAMTNL